MMRTQFLSGIVAALLAFPIFVHAQTQSIARISQTDAPATPDGTVFSCPNGGTVLINQPPNQTNGIFSDSDCGLCGSGQQSLADDFILAAAAEVSQIVLWGGYFPANQIPAPADAFTVIFHQEAAGLPGGVIATPNVASVSLVPTGVVLFGVSEVEIVLDIDPVALGAGTYWVEIFTSTVGNTDQFFWEVGVLDGVSGRLNNAFAQATPGVNWLTGNPVSDNAFALCGAGVPPDEARFLTSKNFNDDNEAEVEVTLSCNTGLPLEQTTTIAEGDPVNFVIVDFEQGALDCEITEVVPDGYSVVYNGGAGCEFENLFGGQYICNITNNLDQVEIEVTKVWIDENPQFAAQNVADATWSCSNVAFGQNNGLLQFFGNPGEDSFFVFPDWESGTTCSIVEVGLNESGVEVDDSECDGLVVLPGEGASCTIFNTRLFEGIPTLSQYGLGVLALLMLGVGFVAFRRLI